MAQAMDFRPLICPALPALPHPFRDPEQPGQGLPVFRSALPGVSWLELPSPEQGHHGTLRHGSDQEYGASGWHPKHHP